MIIKHEKDHTNLINYRQIALTSVISKVPERILNDRLLEYLIMNNILTSVHCGCRKNRSIVDHLVRLETSISQFFAEKHCISIFYDIEKVYDTTWRCRVVRNTGLRSRFPQYIENFLKIRAFLVKLSQPRSRTYN